MNIDHVNYLIEINRTKSLSAAAKALGISQPVLSRYLQNLQDEYQTEFFYYSDKKMHITEAGRIYLSAMTQIRDIETQMVRRFSQQKHDEKHTLKIGMSPFRGGIELAYLYPRLSEHFHNLDLEVKEGNSRQLLAMLRTGMITCILNYYNPVLMPDMLSASINKFEILLGIPSYHPLSAGGGTLENPGIFPNASLPLLSDLPFVFLSPETILGYICTNHCRQRGLELKPFLDTTNSLAVRDMLSSGAYGGFYRNNSKDIPDNVKLFHFEKPLMVSTGLIYLKTHIPDEAEKTLYRLEIERERTSSFLYINKTGEALLQGE
ncbi:MAG: LysR family transcriptional regulator [Solobacterium sp.]|nr:LysR family transcriptional regulator [Solobacterium sp.]MBR3344515.1 LysR family transcriptional regulator [Solobacterium sp.]